MGGEAVSPNPPVVGSLALQATPDPVVGTVTLTWSASDPDGETLRFDLLYGADGVHFEPVHLNIEGASVQVDTAALAGGAVAAVPNRGIRR